MHRYAIIFAEVSKKLSSIQSDQNFGKKCPIFGNVAKAIAKLQKLKLKVENSCNKLLLNVKLSTTNRVLKLLS